jgi:hypothetical protein
MLCLFNRAAISASAGKRPLDQVRDRLRLENYACLMETSYLSWLKYYKSLGVWIRWQVVNQLFSRCIWKLLPAVKECAILVLTNGIYPKYKA